MAQLKQGKFRKIESRFNIKSAVEEIRSIEQYSADAKQIKMTIEYFDFPGQILRPTASSIMALNNTNYLIHTDKKRL